MWTTNQRLESIGQIRDLIGELNPVEDPFLYHLPELLLQPDFKYIDADLALRFVKLVMKRESQPIVYDALKILNKLVNKDGTLHPGGSDIFYDNRHFIWKELSTKTKPDEIILHIFNKTLFSISMGGR